MNKKDWNDFLDSGLFTLMNTFLHVFGWAICIVRVKDTDEILDVYPARIKFRGF